MAGSIPPLGDQPGNVSLDEAAPAPSPHADSVELQAIKRHLFTTQVYECLCELDVQTLVVVLKSLTDEHSTGGILKERRVCCGGNRRCPALNRVGGYEPPRRPSFSWKSNRLCLDFPFSRETGIFASEKRYENQERRHLPRWCYLDVRSRQHILSL